MRDNPLKIEVSLDEAPSDEHVEHSIPSRAGGQYWVTYADLHGNALLAAYHLITTRILELNSRNETEAAYDALARSYKALSNLFSTPNEQSYRKETIDKIRENITTFVNNFIRLQAFNPNVSVRFLGDMLADRGVLDLLMLIILKTLKEKGINYEIIFSNHDVEFFFSFIRNILKLTYFPTNLSLPNELTRSMNNLKFCITYNIISLEEIKKLYTECYLPHLKLLSYDTNKNFLILYSHAPIDFDVVANACHKLGVNYRDDTQAEFLESIDRLNKAFLEKIISGEFSKLYKEELILDDEIRTIVSNINNEINKYFSMLKPLILETLENYLIAYSEELLQGRLQDIVNEQYGKLLNKYNQFDISALENLLSSFKSKNDIFLNKNISDITDLLSSYKSSINMLGSNYQCYKDTPLFTLLWSRMETAVDNRELQSTGNITLRNGNAASFVSQYYWPCTGWKKNAINRHGHTGPESDIKDLSNNLSPFYSNADKSNLGKGMIMEGDLIQYFSYSRKPLAETLRFFHEASEEETDAKNPASQSPKH